MHWLPPVSEFVLIYLLCSNNYAKFCHSFTQYDICGQWDFCAHYQSCSISHKRWFSHKHVTAPLLRFFPKIANPPVLSRTLLNVKSYEHCLSCLLPDSNNVIKLVCAVPEWYNCHMLQPVHEFVEPVAAFQTSEVIIIFEIIVKIGE